jgi:hypothetical protein
MNIYVQIVGLLKVSSQFLVVPVTRLLDAPTRPAADRVDAPTAPGARTNSPLQLLHQMTRLRPPISKPPRHFFGANTRLCIGFSGSESLSLTHSRMISHLTAFSSLFWRPSADILEPHRRSQHYCIGRREESILVSLRTILQSRTFLFSHEPLFLNFRI